MLPVEHVIGAVDDGWAVATGLLFHERNMVAGNSLNDHVEEARRDDGDIDSGTRSSRWPGPRATARIR